MKKNVSDKRCRNAETNILCLITFSENRAVYEIMRENLVDAERPQMTIKYGACALHAG
jgi:hypothetical protein